MEEETGVGGEGQMTFGETKDFIFQFILMLSLKNSTNFCKQVS
jgi:hypothetical protein